MVEQLQRFNSQLHNNHEFISVCVQDVFYDDVLDSLVKQCNPVSALRNTNVSEGDGANLFTLTSLQSPMIGYRFRNHYRVLAGFLTLNKLKKAISQKQLQENFEVPFVLLNKKPSAHIRKHIIQFDLTNSLLDKCFTSDTKKIAVCLKTWFKKDEGRRSIYQSSEWQALYPNLTTSKKLADYLCISTKDL
jgi:hypothetical protein